MTLGALVAVPVVAFVVRRVRSHFAGQVDPGLLDVTTSTVNAVTILAVSAFIVVVWGQTPRMSEALAGLNPLEALPQLIVTLGVLLGTYVLNGVVRRFAGDLLGRGGRLTEHQREVVFRLTQVGLYGAALLTVLSIWGQNLGGLLVGAGFAGIVVGLAARQTLGSLIAGFVLMFARPFEIGDWVEIGDREGIVTDITVVNTRIQTFDGEYVMLPNDYVSGNEVVNRTRKGRLRLNVEVGIDYDEDPRRAAEVAIEAMRDIESVLTVPTPQVVFKRFDDSAIVLECRFWIDKPSARRKWRARTAVIGAVKAAFDREGVKIPFPQRELSGRAETGWFRHAEGVPDGVSVVESEEVAGGGEGDGVTDGGESE